jgi:hypothetical protein
MRRVYALKDTTLRGTAIRKGDVLGPDEQPWPEPDGVDWWTRDVLEADTSEAELAAQRSQTITGASRGSAGWVSVPGRAQPRRITPRGADEPPETEEVAPAAPVQPKAPAVLGDARHVWPAQEGDSDEAYAAYLAKLREMRAQIDAENRARAEK